MSLSIAGAMIPYDLMSSNNSMDSSSIKVKLTIDQAKCCESIMTHFLQQHVREYEEHQLIRHEKIDEKKWKRVRKDKQYTIYKERHPSSSTNRSRNHTHHHHHHHHHRNSSGYHRASIIMGENLLTNMPMLLSVGQHEEHTSIEDLIYGLMGPTNTSTRLKRLYMEEEMEESQILATIVPPQKNTPLTSLVLKSTTINRKSMVKNFLRVRDFVYLEATGFIESLDGSQRIGYHVLHSIEVPEYPEFKDKSIVRGNIATCTMFRQKKYKSHVEFYSKGIVDLKGNIVESVALNTACEMMMMAIMKANFVSQQKKLTQQFLFKTKQNVPFGSILYSTKSQNYCGACNRMFRSFQRHFECSLCSLSICSKCMETRRLYLPRSTSSISSNATTSIASSSSRSSSSSSSSTLMNSEMREVSTVVCKKCLVQVDQLNAEEMARQEFVGESAAEARGIQDKCEHSVREPQNATSTSSSATTSTSSSPVFSSSSSPVCSTACSPTSVYSYSLSATLSPPPPPPVSTAEETARLTYERISGSTNQPRQSERSDDDSGSMISSTGYSMDSYGSEDMRDTYASSRIHGFSDASSRIHGFSDASERSLPLRSTIATTGDDRASERSTRRISVANINEEMPIVIATEPTKTQEEEEEFIPTRRLTPESFYPFAVSYPEVYVRRSSSMSTSMVSSLLHPKDEEIDVDEERARLSTPRSSDSSEYSYGSSPDMLTIMDLPSSPTESERSIARMDRRMSEIPLLGDVTLSPRASMTVPPSLLIPSGAIATTKATKGSLQSEGFEF